MKRTRAGGTAETQAILSARSSSGLKLFRTPASRNMRPSTTWTIQSATFTIVPLPGARWRRAPLDRTGAAPAAVFLPRLLPNQQALCMLLVYAFAGGGQSANRRSRCLGDTMRRLSGTVGRGRARRGARRCNWRSRTTGTVRRGRARPGERRSDHGDNTAEARPAGKADARVVAAG